MQLEGKVAIVTGAHADCWAYAEALASEGAAVVAADINDCGDTVAAIEAAVGERSAHWMSPTATAGVMAALARDIWTD